MFRKKLGNRGLVGLDIGSSSVKAVELAGKPGSLSLVNLGFEGLQPDTVVDGQIMELNDVSGVISGLFAANQFKTDRVAAGVSGSSVIVNSKIVPLNYALRSGDIVEVLTSKRERGPSRDWLAVVKTTRARNKIKQWFKQESRQDTEHSGRALLQEHLTKAGLPPQKIAGSPLLADVIREMGFRKAEDFYVALGAAKITPKVVVNNVLLRLAKCCRPVPGDPIVGYVSLGRGITIHRDDCPNTAALRKDPERFVRVHWEGEHEKAFKVELQVDAWDRHRLLEDLSRTFAEAGCNIVEARCIVSSPMVQNRFVVEVADTQALKQTVNRLRNIDGVFDAYRVTPGAG